MSVDEWCQKCLRRAGTNKEVKINYNMVGVSRRTHYVQFNFDLIQVVYIRYIFWSVSVDLSSVRSYDCFWLHLLCILCFLLSGVLLWKYSSFYYSTKQVKDINEIYECFSISTEGVANHVLCYSCTFYSIKNGVKCVFLYAYMMLDLSGIVILHLYTYPSFMTRTC